MTSTMRIEVQLFGILADQLARRELTVALPAGATVGDLLSKLTAAHAPVAAMAGRLAVAVNMAYVKAGHVIEEGDEVALIPPVSGG